LYSKIFDPTNPGDPITAMPAFGRNGWLSDDEIKAVVAYLKTIN
jgi:sulfur-oxidizing protein SoxX